MPDDNVDTINVDLFDDAIDEAYKIMYVKKLKNLNLLKNKMRIESLVQ